MKATDEQIKDIAYDFSLILFNWLSKNDFQEMVDKTMDESDPSICYSHDYCDANVAMTEAMDKNGFPFISGRVSEDYFTICNQAWSHAKVNQFFIDTLISNDQHEFKY